MQVTKLDRSFVAKGSNADEALRAHLTAEADNYSSYYSDSDIIKARYRDLAENIKNVDGVLFEGSSVHSKLEGHTYDLKCFVYPIGGDYYRIDEVK